MNTIRRVLLLGICLVLVSILITGCTIDSLPTPTGTTEPEPTTPVSTSPPTSPTITLPPGTEINYETVIEPQQIGGSYKGENAQIQVLSNSIEPPLASYFPETLGWLYPADREKVFNVDYTEYFVILAFNGWRANIYGRFNIERIWQNDRTIYVLAHFNNYVPGSTYPTASCSQYEAVQISLDQLAQQGEYTFKLLDESGEEKASTTVRTSPQTSPSVSLPSGTDMNYETVSKLGQTGSRYKREDAQIRVLAGPSVGKPFPSTIPEPFTWLQSQDSGRIHNGVDYANFFVILAFNGYREGIQHNFKIQRVWLDGTTIYVLAHFNNFMLEATGSPEPNSQYEAVMVLLDELTYQGQYTIKLLDETWQERASTTVDILRWQ